MAMHGRGGLRSLTRSSLFLQSDPNMSKMMQAMQDPEYKNKVENAMKSLKDDPDMGGIFEELEKAGPAAMMK